MQGQHVALGLAQRTQEQMVGNTLGGTVVAVVTSMSGLFISLLALRTLSWKATEWGKGARLRPGIPAALPPTCEVLGESLLSVPQFPPLPQVKNNCVSLMG